ncbi:MAG: manganese catalase family protein [Clostridia bacterium]|nr:manganese catalase family protein [Clostridia bacterium]
MWQYQKNLEYPIRIKNPDPRMAKLIITQYGGGDGELGAALRYLSQRFTMPTGETKGLLTDVGTEELAHLEMIGTMCTQLLDGATCKQLRESGYDTNYVEHGIGVYPANAAGVPFTASYIQSKGDPVTDLTENLAAEQKAKQTYEYLIDMADDPDVIAPLKFLRAREIIHFQRFGEALQKVQELNGRKKYY